MPRSCACCDHPNRAAIEAAIILPGQSLRAVARAHGLTPAALHRHARNHLPAVYVVAAAARLAAIDAGTVPEIEPAEAPPEIETSFTDAAPHVPRALDFGDGPTDDSAPQGSRQASVPAAPAPSHHPEATIASSAAPAGPMGLLQLAHSLRDRALGILASAEASGDQRTALAAIREARGVLESLARLEPAGNGSAVPLAQSPEWHQLRSVLIGALAPHPEARLAVATALAGAGALE